MYKLTYIININQKVISQTLSISKNEVLIEISDKKLIYFKELNSYYQINTNDKTLTIVDSSKINDQINAMRQLIEGSSLVLKQEHIDFKGYEAREFEFINSNTAFSIKSIIKNIFVNRISESAYPNFQLFEAKTQLIDIPYLPDEIMAYNKSEIAAPQGMQIQEIELISVSAYDCAEEISQILSYQTIN